ncbi:hypothetical protein S1001342_00575 [Acetobacter pasteurianus subsp. pasteurianus]|uniref:Uncharacterized protein n=1 Tax=Acetobacter pasteurianus subsp. pasteurianus TaxID=481145 RepID=A0A1Y0XVJ9_ACEPA|nr:hypothetical protein S1001342_00575 [Acetobacter pasteurianus subsp. pasteurianus]
MPHHVGGQDTLLEPEGAVFEQGLCLFTQGNV